MNNEIRILMLEDVPADAELVERELHRAGVVFTSKRVDTKDAFARELEDFKPDIVLADYKLPAFDGRSAVQLVRQKHPEVPVVMVTGTLGDEAVVELLKAGARDYVLKDGLARLGPAVRRALSEERGIRARKQAERAVKERESRFRSLIEQASDLVAVVDVQGKIAYISPAIKRLGGYEVDEFLGTQYLDYAHPEDRAAATAGLAELLRDPGKLHVSEFRFRAKDGAWVTLESIARNVLDDPAINGIVINSRDVTERKRAEDRIARLNRLYATLSGINTAIVHAASPAELFDRVCEVAVEHGQFSMAWIGTVDRAHQTVTPVAHRGLTPEDVVAIRDSIGRFEKSAGRTATAIRERRPIYVNDYDTKRTFTPWHAQAVKHGIRGSATLPIKQGGEIVGVLKLYVLERDFFDAEQLVLLEEMGADLSFALDRFDTEAKKTQAETALLESEVRFRALIENASDMTAVIGQDGTISYVSPSCKRVGGYEPDELLGRNILEFIHPDDAQTAASDLSKVIRVPEGTHDAELRYRHKDGSWRVFETLTRNLLADPAVRGIVANMRDVTERNRAVEELRRVNWALRALSQGNSALVHAGDEQELFQSCCEAITGAGGYPLAWIGIARDDPERTIEIAASAGEAIGFMNGFEVSWGDTTLGRGSTGTAIRTGTTQINNDFTANPAFTPWLARARANALASVISLPIRTNGAMAGVLTVYSREPIAFGEDEVKLLEQLAGDIGYGISNRRTRVAYEEGILERAQQALKLRAIFESAIAALAATVEQRDPYTAGHERRVAELAIAIGRELGLDEQRIEGLRIASIIHDIGKISVPAEILSRPGKLTKAEFAIVQGHAQAGYEIVKGVDFPWPVAQMILQHHERLDGSGYPQGLKGDAIIFEARILAVADVIEAMSSHRPYRPGLGIDAALAQLGKEAGTTLDAAVAEACERLFQKKGFRLPD